MLGKIMHEIVFEDLTKKGLESKIAAQDEDFKNYNVSFEKSQDFFYVVLHENKYVGKAQSIDESEKNLLLTDSKVIKSYYKAKINYFVNQEDIKLYNSCKQLIRKGNILNTLGVIRALNIFGGSLTKEKFSSLVKDNYLTPALDKRLKNEINNTWKNAEKYLKEINELDSFSDEIIVLKVKSKKKKMRTE